METSVREPNGREAGGPATPVEAPRLPRLSVDLDIAGEDFMLQGHFSDWESGLAVGPDLDRVSVRLAIDATSARQPVAGPSLFAFHSRRVESSGAGAYRAIGTFTGPMGARALEVMIESPPGHTALILVTFVAKRQDFGPGWHDLIANVVPFEDGGEGAPARQAHAWLIAPSLGTA